ncbi:MAG: SMP-30/gluconolactonase/LRE family protein [Planctomycetota bacterium]|jgi:gluconolactonase
MRHHRPYSIGKIVASLIAVALLAPLAAAQVTAPGATPQLAGDGFQFTEGPAADPSGAVYFTDIPNNRIHKWNPDGKITTFLENSGGTNGLYFDARGQLLGCAGGDGRLISVAPDATVTPLIEKHDGKRFNRPNDLWIDPMGGIFFTDPAYGRVEITQGGEHVYYLDPKRRSVTRVANDYTRPNGLIGTPDGKTLYIADAGAGKIFRYAVNPNGQLADKTLFVERGSDGMTIDNRGNIYLTNQGAVWVYNRQGKLVQKIETPKGPSNVTFAGPDFQTLFITARDSVFTLKMKTRGVRYP